MQQQEQNELVQYASVSQAQLRILVADDSRVMQALLAQLLNRLGHEVTIVATGLAALELLETQRFDLIFMDIEMPVMNGLETTIAIRRRDGVGGWRTPIIAMTAHAAGGFEQRCLDIGMDGYVTKPVEPKELLTLIRRFTDGKLRPL